MEPIKDILGRLGTPEPTRGRKITDKPQPPETPEEQSERREKLRLWLNISSLDNTFENFKPAQGTGMAFAAFRQLASGETDWHMLLCYGGVGNGKTHLCEATAIEFAKRGLYLRVNTMAKMMQSLKAGMNPQPIRPYIEMFNGLCICEYLIIDDVGMGGSGSDWEYGQLEEIVAHRYRENLFTILTTNRDLTELPPRIISRFRDPDKGRVILNSGEDYRGRK